MEVSAASGCRGFVRDKYANAIVLTEGILQLRDPMSISKLHESLKLEKTVVVGIPCLWRLSRLFQVSVREVLFKFQAQ